jgi:hypothetical protein
MVDMRKTYALGLAVLAVAFMLRVVGQALVATVGVSFLPPMHHWQSGLLPYGLLLLSQVLILGVQARISADIWRGAGRFAWCKPKVGRVLRLLSVVYFLAMVVRYGVTMYLHPERRWLGGTIPIIFHCVLAAYLFLLGRYYSSAACVTTAKN